MCLTAHARRPKTRHDSLAIYILLRGITLLVRCGNKPNAPPAVRKLLTVTRLKHGDTALMCACTSQVRPRPAYINALAEALIHFQQCIEVGRLVGLCQSALCSLVHESLFGDAMMTYNLCLMQIGYSWICKPHTLPPTFVHFLNHHGGKELWFYKAAKVLPCFHPFPLCTWQDRQAAARPWHPSKAYTQARPGV